METKTCKDCKYYIQHYGKFNNKYSPIGCGHCMKVWPNGKFRKTNKLCEHFKDAKIIYT